MIFKGEQRENVPMMQTPSRADTGAGPIKEADQPMMQSLEISKQD